MKDTPIVDVDSFDWSIFQTCQLVKTRGRKKACDSKTFYLDLVTGFDIETSTIVVDEKPKAFMYIWQWQIGESQTVVGRNWEDFKRFVDGINAIPRDFTLVVYVFNLSYEFQFLAGVLRMDGAEIFATDLREVVRVKIGKLEFRCAMRLTNDNLSHWLKEKRVDHQKLPDYDYNKLRYPWTELSGRELAYCVNDVVGLVEGIEQQLKDGQDNLYTIPMTSTGYVRRRVKEAMKAMGRGYIEVQTNELAIYDLLREAFRGGDTHANRYYAGCHLGRVYSYDRSSSYPDVMIHCRFPVSKFRKEKPTEDSFSALRTVDRALLMRVKLEGVRVKDWNTCPYISFSKCKTISDDYKLDNGRVLSCSWAVMAITDIDYDLIMNEYDVEKVKFIELYSARYGFLPMPLRQVIIDLYKTKTELKGVEGAETEYALSKALLNACYGMMVQRVITPRALFQPDGKWEYDTEYIREMEYKKAIEKAYTNYAWGVWVCAHARKKLHIGIECMGWDNFVYADTDSVKGLAEADFSEFNAKCIADCEESGAWGIDSKGVKHYMGVFESEGYYDEFKTLGAKRYVYMKDGKLGATIAGVSKKEGPKELERLGGIDAFTEGVEFTDAGHIAAYYNDTDDLQIVREGHPLRITRNVALIQTPYKLKLGKDYAELLEKSSYTIDKYVGLDYNIIGGTQCRLINKGD